MNAINSAGASWGIQCLRYEIRDIQLPARVVESMQTQVAAERKKRAQILESEGERESSINIAEGHKRAVVLASEARQIEQVNRARGEAEAIVAIADATSLGIRRVAGALGEARGSEAVAMQIAKDYVAAFGNIAKAGNTILLPTATGDVASMVTQALSIYKTVSAATVQSDAAAADSVLESAVSAGASSPPGTSSASVSSAALAAALTGDKRAA